MSEPAVTTEDLLDEAEARTGLARGQLVLMAAKSATIRHIATDHAHRGRFVLKGGSLLTHVYKSPRQSIADADYAHLDRETLTTVDLEQAFTGERDGLTLDAQFQWVERGFDGTATYELAGIEVRGRAPHSLKVSISIRPGEWLDRRPEVEYHDPLLAQDNRFPVQGLSREELAAEKVLGWASKDLPKHIVDLAYLEREWGAGDLEYDRIGDLVRRKFTGERHYGRYRARGIGRVADLAGAFCDPDRLRLHLHGDYARLVGDELLFLPPEQERPGDQTLTAAANVERLGLAFWDKLAPHL